MPGFISTNLPGWRALPGDLLYLADDHDGADLPRGYYVLAGQCSDEEVLLLRAGEDGGGSWCADRGDPIPAPVLVLNRMVGLDVRVPRDGCSAPADDFEEVGGDR
jgi:hypothetical protein